VTVLKGHDWLSDWQCATCTKWGVSGSADERKCGVCGAELCADCLPDHYCEPGFSRTEPPR
jgi:hypothetical protein